MKRPFSNKRPVGPFAEGPFDTEEKQDAVAEFTIDKDSIDVQMKEPAGKSEQAREEVINIISPRFSDFEIETTRTGDFRVQVDVTDSELGDIAWLENQIDKAEKHLDIYNVKVDVGSV